LSLFKFKIFDFISKSSKLQSNNQLVETCKLTLEIDENFSNISIKFLFKVGSHQVRSIFIFDFVMSFIFFISFSNLNIFSSDIYFQENSLQAIQ